MEKTSPERIRHIPHILYHWRAILGSVALGAGEKSYAYVAARNAIQAHLNRKNIAAKVALDGNGSVHRVVYDLPVPAPKVSAIICTRDRVELLKSAVKGLFEKTRYPSLQLIIVDNQSREKATLDYFDELRSDSRVTIVKYDAHFNFSAMNNLGAKSAEGELLLLLNNDIEVISSGWLTEMASIAAQPEVGAVGAKLLYPGDTVQHGGVILGVGGVAGHIGFRETRHSPGYMGRGRVLQSLSAVTAACLVTRRSVFEEVGGFDEKHLPVAFNDVDLCLKIRERGYRIVWTPYAELYHMESASRGSDSAPENFARYCAEYQFMKDKWGNTLLSDPAYNPNLSLKRLNFGMAFPPRADKPWRKVPPSKAIPSASTGKVRHSDYDVLSVEQPS